MIIWNSLISSVAPKVDSIPAKDRFNGRKENHTTTCPLCAGLLAPISPYGAETICRCTQCDSVMDVDRVLLS